MNPTLAVLVGGFGMGTGVTSLAFAWWFYRARPRAYFLATVSDDLPDGADCPGCAAGSLWERSHRVAPYVPRECRQPDSSAV